MSKYFCLYLFLSLFVASLSLQFFRAKLRKKINRLSSPHMRGTEFEGRWDAAGRGLGWIFEDFNKMKLVKAFSSRLPSDILIELRKFKILNSIELVTTVTMLLTAAFAYLVCN